MSDPAIAGQQPPPPIPEHELIRSIGRGASGEVWLARNRLGTFRAVKIVWLRPGQQPGPANHEFGAIFRSEPLSRLHDGLVDILQVGSNEGEGFFYYVMELGDDVQTGQTVYAGSYSPRTLGYDIRQRGRLPVAECMRIGSAIASALSFLHANSLIHRDVKPANIIYINGFPKLADVGLVSDIVAERSQIGTAGFIAPEGSGGAPADVYSLGKLLYEMSTGLSASAYPQLPENLTDSKEGLELLQFFKIVQRACRKELWRRYATADDLMMDLLSFQFVPRDWRSKLRSRRLDKWAGILGWIIGGGFAIFVVWRLVWLIEHTAGD